MPAIMNNLLATPALSLVILREPFLNGKDDRRISPLILNPSLFPAHSELVEEFESFTSCHSERSEESKPLAFPAHSELVEESRPFAIAQGDKKMLRLTKEIAQGDKQTFRRQHI